MKLETVVAVCIIGAVALGLKVESAHASAERHTLTVSVKGQYPSTEDTNALIGRGPYLGAGKGWTFYVPKVLSDYQQHARRQGREHGANVQAGFDCRRLSVGWYSGKHPHASLWALRRLGCPLP